VNGYHRWLCRSDGWRATVQKRVPWVIGGIDLGPNPLEIGPGPGLTTDLLRHIAPQLTAIEIDATCAKRLGTRLTGSNVTVIHGDATSMPFSDDQFSAALTFTTLHHVPSAGLQDRLLREVRRVLKPGGLFMGSDSIQSLAMRLIHIGDVLVPVDPDTFGVRLETAGFQVLAIEKRSDAFRFMAQRPRRAYTYGE
jgi:SAM-dependent methyltransferase